MLACFLAKTAIMDMTAAKPTITIIRIYVLEYISVLLAACGSGLSDAVVVIRAFIAYQVMIQIVVHYLHMHNDVHVCGHYSHNGICGLITNID